MAINNIQMVNGNTPPFVTNSSTQFTLSPELAEAIAKNEVPVSADMARYYQYKENLTDWRKKLDDVLLEFTDPNYPHFGIQPQSEDQLKMQLENQGILVPIENVSEKFGIISPTADAIYVEIIVDTDTSTDVIDPYMINVTGRSFHIIYGWVYLDDIQPIASLEKVRTVYAHADSNIQKKVPEPSTTINHQDVNTPIPLQPSATHASSFSVICPFLALFLYGIFGLKRK